MKLSKAQGFIVLITISALKLNAQTIKDTWHFKSSQDDFQVNSVDGRLLLGEQPVNKKVFDDFLKLMLRPNREDCPTLTTLGLSVEAKSGTNAVVKKFYPVEGVIEANGKCGALDYDAGWSLPIHRDWFTAEYSAKIVVGPSMSFKSADLNFQVARKDKEWVPSGKGFIPDLQRVSDFASSLENFRIEKRYAKKVKDSASRTFTLSTSGEVYKFYNIKGLWTIESPRSNSLVATKDFSMIGNFTRNELGDNRSVDMGVLSDKNAKPEERIELLEKMSNVDSPAFKSTLHQILKDPDENPSLKERVALLLVDRPSAENVRALMTMLEKGSVADQVIATKVMRRLNPAGPMITQKDQFTSDEKLRKWREWYAKFRQAQK